MRVKYNSSASCLLRLLLTSLWPAAGQQLRRRREGPCPRAPRKGSRGSGRRFRDRASGTARASGGELPPQPRPPRPRSRRRWAGERSRPWPRQAPEGSSAGPGVPSVLVWVQNRPPPAAGRSPRPGSQSDRPGSGVNVLLSSPHPEWCLPRPRSLGEGLLWKRAERVSSEVGLATAGWSPGERCLERS